MQKETEMTGHGETTGPTFVIVGAGLAGANAAAHLRKKGFDGRIVLVGEEGDRPYERPPLSKDYLRGAEEREKLDVQAAGFYAEQSIDLRTTARAIAIEPASREVVLDDGARIPFDRLLIATGALPRRLEVPGSDLAGIHVLRTVADADAIREHAARAHRAAVIGGGWVGSEVAASLRQLGLSVALIMPGSTPLERALGTEIGAVYRDLHAGQGVELHPKQRATAFRGRTAVEAIETGDGSLIEADLVVVGVGAQPRVDLAAEAGLVVGDGIHVDEHLETSVPGIFAAGDVAAAWHPVFGSRIRVEHWDNAKRQGRLAAQNMLGGADSYERIPYLYSDQFDLSMEYAGHAPAWDRVVVRGDPRAGSFVAFWLLGGRVVAGMNANVPKVNDAIGALVRAGRTAVVERLADPAVPLADLDALLLPAPKSVS
jgi:3-phenylpropionate/trans-cinnamate dioxygenase ferredoxin reductase subunit